MNDPRVNYLRNFGGNDRGILEEFRRTHFFYPLGMIAYIRRKCCIGGT